MLRVWIILYVMALCCNRASFFYSDFVLFNKIISHEKAHLDQLYVQQRCSQINLVKQPPIFFNQQRIAYQNNKKNEEYTNNQILEGLLSYSRKFRKLNFTLQQQQLRNLAYDVRQLYSKDKLALFFVSAYFIRACQILEKNNTPAYEIVKIIKRKINTMMNITSISTFRKQKFGEKQLQLTSDYWQPIMQQVKSMNSKKFNLLQQNKDQQIEQIIMEMVQEAKSKFFLFNQIVQSSCKANNGLSYHINFKLQNRKQLQEMKRIKQKLLKKYLQIYGDKCSNNIYNIQLKRKIDEKKFQNLLNKIYKELNELQFIVKDLLRAKCMFHSIQDIKGTALTIIDQIKKLTRQGFNIKLVEFQNRIDKITCDIVLVIQIDSLSYEIQLTLLFDQNLFEISHKMYQLLRSKSFSPIALLFEWFQKTAPNFLSKVAHYFVQNQQAPEETKSISSSVRLDKQNLIKQYQLLNQFFNITSYNDFIHKDQQQFYQQIEVDLARNIQRIIQPFNQINSFSPQYADLTEI